jgi:hypothetical protein
MNPATAAQVEHRAGELRSGTPPLWATGVAALAAAKLGMHVMTLVVTPYGVHRDELLYVAMGKYLRVFAMDFPPFIALLANGSRARDFYAEVTLVERLPNPWGVPEQQDNPIVVARRPIATLQEVWPELGGGN